MKERKNLTPGPGHENPKEIIVDSDETPIIAFIFSV